MSASDEIEIENMESRVRFQRPKILLLDLPEAASGALEAKGFNVASGSLGTPYHVPQESGYRPVICHSASLPNYTEAEIVVVDFSLGELSGGPDGEKHRPASELDVWAKTDQGIIDPRSRSVVSAMEAFNRTYNHGGIFIVFAEDTIDLEMVVAKEVGSAHSWDSRLMEQEVFRVTLWNLVTELSYLGRKSDSGTEIDVCDDNVDPRISRILRRFISGTPYDCTFYGNEWIPLAKNKFGEPVAMHRHDKGHIFVFPQIPDQSAFLAELFTETLPGIAPELFPDLVKGAWIHDPEYEIPSIRVLASQQKEIQIRAEQEISDLEKIIAAERKENAWTHELLTGTDDGLVVAVTRALEILGFEHVVDVDEERDAAGESRREDLQIKDRDEVLIVDIKGIGGSPSDSDVQQAEKHATLRMREWKTTDVSGLSIINHQRHLPPLDRENSMPFRQEILEMAEAHSLGLMTGWDLFRLVRNARKLGWESEAIIPLFYRRGRIEIVPEHYEYLGKIAIAWSEKYGIVMEGEVKVGDRVAIEFPVEFEEVTVSSIQVNDKPVDLAGAGDEAGFLWSSELPNIRKGMRVYRVDQSG